MQAVARKACRVLLFLTLLTSAVLFLHTYPYPMPFAQLEYWMHAANLLGISNPENLYFPTMWLIDLVAAVIAYRVIIRLFRRLRAREPH
ncbi:hypothetical protein SAMN03159495_3796 [Pseudomonas sp. NFR16]|nr:hypothetical protein SAMN03159495_3796 [Pseudomonas sp. NFR16]